MITKQAQQRFNRFERMIRMERKKERREELVKKYNRLLEEENIL